MPQAQSPYEPAKPAGSSQPPRPGPGVRAAGRPDERDLDARTARGERMAAAGKLLIRSERRAAVHVVAVTGELDLATAQDLDDALRAAEAGDAERVVLDLSGLDFIDSTGMRLVLVANARPLANGRRLVLRRGPRRVQRVFEITGVVSILPFTD